jgi:hypothetical protein
MVAHATMRAAASRATRASSRLRSGAGPTILTLRVRGHGHSRTELGWPDRWLEVSICRCSRPVPQRPTARTSRVDKPCEFDRAATRHLHPGKPGQDRAHGRGSLHIQPVRREVDAEDVGEAHEVDGTSASSSSTSSAARRLHDRAASSGVSHWKISSSSPTSPASAIARFFGVWNCSQSRSRANSRSSHLQLVDRVVAHGASLVVVGGRSAASSSASRSMRLSTKSRVFSSVK